MSLSPQLQQWMLENTKAGCSLEVLQENLRKAGWTEDVVAQALDSVAGPSSNSPQGMPGAHLAQAPRRIDVGDAWVDVLLKMREPRIVVLGHVLSDFECDALIQASQAQLESSQVVDDDTGAGVPHAHRSSSGTYFRRGATPLIQRIDARLARLLNWPEECSEDLQILHYGPGAEYKPHYDYFDLEKPGLASHLTRGGQRLATLILYLNDPEQGGATIFPDVGLEVLPKRGHAVFFSYEQPTPASKTLHGGAPVVAGEKWIATKWLRQGKFV